VGDAATPPLWRPTARAVFHRLGASRACRYRKEEVMGTIVEKTVVVGPEEWRKAASRAHIQAVSWLFDGNTKITTQSDRLKNAAELLRAADAFNGRANHQEMFGEVDTAVIEEWDLSDEMEGEDDEPIWPEMSAKLREVAGADPKLLPLVDQIDRLHKLAVERGMPVVTRAQFEQAMEEAA
jgi:hypothetical protein